ncbi:MAG: carboxypeptidase-like regulatory domain-containing protein, partial [Phaeodactylibacter sp.]|nr:carboxypeptidase-like regulatory domain-containing protein [Phaeodactylibacter sp.]
MNRAIRYSKMGLFFLLFILSGTRKAAAQACHLFGFIKEGSTGEAIIGAYVYAPGLARGTTTNSQGFYMLPLPCQDTVLVIYQSLGYQPDSLWAFLSEDRLIINGSLHPGGVALEIRHTQDPNGLITLMDDDIVSHAVVWLLNKHGQPLSPVAYRGKGHYALDTTLAE